MSAAVADFDKVEHATMLITKPRYGWTPAGPYSYAVTPCKRLVGSMGDDLVSIARRRKVSGNGYEYAAIFISPRGLVAGEHGRTFKAVGDPMLDSFAVEQVADWTSRGRVAELLAKL